MNLYTLENLEQRYNGSTVLAIDRLEIAAGAIHALLGANGAGKTTLLDILAFLQQPACGTVFFQGAAVEYSRSALLALRRRVVLVDQHPIMFSTTVRGNLEFGLKIRKIDRPSRRRIVDEVLETVGLGHYARARADELSGGETQRLALARALALAPEVLLCDEPTASVDADNQAIIIDLLRRINRERGTTIILTTHDRLQAAALAEHTLVLEQGRVAGTVYDNSFGCTMDPRADGGLRCRLHGGPDIVLLTQGRPHRTTGRLIIDPKHIRLEHTAGQTETANRFSGPVVLLMAEDKAIRMVVNLGVPMVVLLDQVQYHQHAPAIGDLVTLTIPEHACTLTA